MTESFETSVICPALIGRTSQLDLFDRVIAQVYGGQGQALLIAGEAGIGKSRLAAEASARFRAYQAIAGAAEPRILQGRCFEPDRVLPYAPLLDLLRTYFATARQRGIPSMQWRILVRLAGLYQAQARRDEAEAASVAARAIVGDLAASLADETLRETFTCAVAARLQRIPPPSPRRATKQAYDGLTAREREVASLIAQGLSNRALADALVLSERTIAKHVENILSKLGFTARAQIAVWAVEKGLAKHHR